jgi:exopolysaccharide biosynthesis polyprenyl glycosylphosphotransferase
MNSKAKTFFLLLGDIVVLYAALLLALWLRYGAAFYDEFMRHHAGPFTVIFALWLIVFYIAGLYDLRRLRNDLEFLKTLFLTLVVNAFLAIILFYLVPAFGIAPKTNLLIFLAVFAIVEILWRRGFNRLAGRGDSPNRVLLVGDGALADEIENAIRENPQLGYGIDVKISADSAEREPAALERLAEDLGVNMVVVPRHLKRNSEFALTLYRLFGHGIKVIDLASFYELVLHKIPLADLEEAWFLENIESAARFYDPLKRALELIFAFAVGVILLPFELLFALFIIITSPGPAIYRQARVGRYGQPFTLYKFRTMRNDAEKDGAQWSSGKADARVTALGRLLRASHLDELPQLWNVIRGDISFVGPRPERPEFVAKLKEQVPYYDMRLLVKPGVSGWAQLNHRADLTLDDVEQKLQYDIYYLKNRSAILDLAIVVRTIKSVFVNPR